MQRVRDAFHLLVDLEPAQRAVQLRALRLSDEDERALVALLEAEERHSALDRPLAEAIQRLRAEVDLSQRMVGSKIGSFRIVQLLGEGGSAVVFRAEREAGSGTQAAAVKLLRAGQLSTSVRRRFQREHAILAQLKHPDIARLIEGGVSDSGIPYIAMELAEGEPITVAADRLGLSVDQRLRLFTRLCRAVDAAHGALIVHCDLKPRNVLVDVRRELKVLDFGIARLICPDTDSLNTRTISLTPEYAAPEQFRGEHPTVAVDVYALGVILRELLTGRRRSDETLVRAVLASDALPVGVGDKASLARRVRGDLESIVAMAARPDPGQRYRSAEALAADVDDALAGRPVRARSAGRWYRVGKFLGRNQMSVAAAAFLVALVIASLATAISQATAARRAAARASAVRDFMVDVLGAAKASLPRDLRPTPDSLVEQASRKLAAAPDMDGRTRAELESTLGEVFLSVSKYGAAEAAVQHALAYANSAGDAAATTRLQVLLAQCWQASGRNAEAANLLRSLGSALSGDAVTRARALAVLGDAELGLDQREQALAHKQEAARLSAELRGPASVDALAARFEVGSVLTDMARYAEAHDVLKGALASWRTLDLPQDNRYVEAVGDFGVASDGLGFYAEADAHAREVLAIKQRIYPAPHIAIARSMRELALILDRRGSHVEAEELLNKALLMQRQVVPESHVEVLATLSGLGITYSVQRRYVEAETVWSKVLATCRAERLRDDVCLAARTSLGISYHRAGRVSDAVRELRAALQERTDRYGDGHFTVAMTKTRLANALADGGAPEEAQNLIEQAQRVLVRQRADQGREWVYAQMVAAKALDAMGAHDRALERVDAVLGNAAFAALEANRRVAALTLKARALRKLGRVAEMRAAVRDARALDVPWEDLWPATERELRELMRFADGAGASVQGK